MSTSILFVKASHIAKPNLAYSGRVKGNICWTAIQTIYQAKSSIYRHFTWKVYFQSQFKWLKTYMIDFQTFNLKGEF